MPYSVQLWLANKTQLGKALSLDSSGSVQSGRLGRLGDSHEDRWTGEAGMNDKLSSTDRSTEGTGKSNYDEEEAMTGNKNNTMEQNMKTEAAEQLAPSMGSDNHKADTDKSPQYSIIVTTPTQPQLNSTQHSKSWV